VTYRWNQAYARRWRSELRALRATGWKYRVVRTGGVVSLRVAYPVGVGATALLRVEFPQTYPYFPAAVFDPDNGLGLSRHRDVVTGMLCVVEESDHRPDQLLADVLATQLPKLVASSRGETGVEEVLAPEPRVGYARRNGPDIIVPAGTPPPGVQQGALVTRFTIINAQLSTGFVTRILGPDVDIRPDINPAWPLRPFRFTVYGRWLRDPDYSPAETAEELWERVSARLLPLEVPADADAEVLPPQEVEVLGLLVPGESTHHVMGEQWAFLIRFDVAPVGEPPQYRVVLRGAQVLSRALADERTPTAVGLAATSVVVVGAGAIGDPLMRGLAQAGVRRLDVVDRDTIDVTTHRRQYAPPTRAGEPKSHIVASRASANAPYCDVRAFHFNLRKLLGGGPDPTSEDNQVAEFLLQQVLAADLVIDATGNVAVTRYLAALRRQHERRFLHVSTTAGAWGGVVAAFGPTDDAPCWSCLEHHRFGGTVPVPAADPDGWVLPRGCNEQTFTGTVADVATIANHAMRVATAWLVDDRELLGGTLHVASLRHANGSPAPVTWTVTDITRHPSCPEHPDVPKRAPSRPASPATRSKR
jgi:hypothetical protein